MESVPLNFCASVISSLKKKPTLRKPLVHTLWNVAIRQNITNAIHLTMTIHCANGVWFIVLHNMNNFTFREIKHVIDRRYLRVTKITVACSVKSAVSGAPNPKACTRSFAKLKEVAHFLRPYVNRAVLEINGMDRISNIEDFLSIFKGSSFSTISLNGNPDRVANFIESQLKSDCLEKLEVNGSDLVAKRMLKAS